MIELNEKSFFWYDFNENNEPIEPKECGLTFNSKDGGFFSFIVKSDDYNINKNNINTIYGYTSKGKKFTLFNLKQIESKLSFAFDDEYIIEVKYSIEYIILGYWINKNEKISHFKVRYSYLEGWLSLVNFDIRKDLDNIFFKECISIRDGNSNLLKSIYQDKILFNINHKLNGVYHYSSNGKLIRQLKNYISCGKYGKFFISDVFHIIVKIQNFFEIVSFHSYNNIFVEELIIFIEEQDIYSEEIHILYKQPNYQEESDEKNNYLFYFKDIENNFTEILNNWINNYDKNINEFKSFLNVITDKTNNINIYSHIFQLLSALEAYHRRNFSITEEENLKHQDYLNTLSKKLEDCNFDKKEDIIKILKYSNQPSFRKRLKELIDTSNIKNILSLNSKIYKSIINYLTEIRNTIAHSKDYIVIDKKLKKCFEFLKIVALLIMVKDINLGNPLDMSNRFSEMNIENLEKELSKLFKSHQ